MKELASLADLGRMLMHDTNEVLLEVREALAASAVLVREQSKSEFGTYQTGLGGFPDWAELAPSTKAERVELGFTENDPLLRTGKLRDSITAMLSDWDAYVGSESPIMPYHEFGTSKIPPRPVLGIALSTCWPQIQKMMGAAVETGILGGPRLPLIHEAASRLDDAGPSPRDIRYTLT